MFLIYAVPPPAPLNSHQYRVYVHSAPVKASIVFVFSGRSTGPFLCVILKAGQDDEGFFSAKSPSKSLKSPAMICVPRSRLHYLTKASQGLT